MPKPRSAVRLLDVAEHAGVSLATASRALTGRTGVSREVADRVRSVSQDLGYVANPHARTLASGVTSMVGLLVHQIDDPYFAEIAGGVIHAAGEHDLTVQVCHTGRDPETELTQIRQLIGQRVGVVVIAGSGYTRRSHGAAARTELSAFREAGGRVAVIGRHSLATDAVLPDNVGGGKAVAGHLLSLGHRNIAVAAGTRELTTVVDRLAGVEAALVDAGLSLSAIPVVETDFTRDGGSAAAERLLRDHPDTTAVIALNDAMAIGVVSTLRAHGVRVPDEVSVAGFDDISVAADIAPGLTTVRLPMAEMGRLALTLALKPPSPRPRRRTTGHQLVLRESTAPPRDRPLRTGQGSEVSPPEGGSSPLAEVSPPEEVSALEGGSP